MSFERTDYPLSKTTKGMEGFVTERVYQENVEGLVGKLRGEIEAGKTHFAKFYEEHKLDKIPTTHAIFKTFVGELLGELKVVPKLERFNEADSPKVGRTPDLIASAEGFEPLAITLHPEKFDDLNYHVKADRLDYGGEKIDVLELGINPDLWIETIATFRAEINQNPETIPSIIATRDKVITEGDFGPNFIATAPEKLVSAIGKR
ncbi:hypothetical protein E3J85_01145 [Patescibacteria group bacterium]|nr:MAG: hypothetical protein E3J85_01145 [Patescibacteria group bacterium]